MFEDLVLKAQGFASNKNVIILPRGEFNVASAMIGKSRLSAKAITSALSLPAGRVSVLLNLMASKQIVEKHKVPNKVTNSYLFSLSVKNFKMKGAE